MPASAPPPSLKPAAGILILVLVVAGWWAIPDYSITWDEGLGDLFFGQRYFSYFTSFDARYLDFKVDPYPADSKPDLSGSPFKVRPWEYYPLTNAIAFGTSRVLSAWLGLLDPFDGFHAVNLLFGAALVYAMLAVAWRRLGPLPATASVLLVFTAPRLVVHLLANTKDFPEAALFAMTLFTFLAALERGSVGGILGAGALAGAALATKANAVFLPPILLAVLLATPLRDAWWGRRRRLWAACAAAPVLGMAVFFGSWPYLWAAPFERLALQARYVSRQIFQVRPESILHPLVALVGTTPLPLLLAALVGVVVACVRLRRRDPLAALALAWTAVTLGRLFLPGAVNFDGVRHFLEIYPALGLLAAFAFSALARTLVERRSAGATAEVFDGAAPGGRGVAHRRRVLPALLLGVLVAAQALAVVRVHPFEIAYWNPLVGGVAGAHRRQLPQAGDYWGLSYRQGMRWLDENAPQGAILAVPVVEHSVRLTSQTRLRSDIGVLNVSLPSRPDIPPDIVARIRRLAAERPVYVMFVPRLDWANLLMTDCMSRLEPVQEWTLSGVPILQIYRYAP